MERAAEAQVGAVSGCPVTAERAMLSRKVKVR